MSEILTPKSPSSAPLLSPDFLRRLERLRLATRRVLGGAIKGERRSKRKGISIDFADYRQYARGDDLRFIDWNIYGRLDRLFIKLFHEEQDLACHILIDCSRSMGYGDPDKLLFARQVAAAIAYVGLFGQDKITITAFRDGVAAQFPAARGRHNTRRMLAFLDRLAPDGETSLEKTTRDFSQRVRGAGIVVLISDLLDPAGFEPALKRLISDRLDVYVIHTLAPQELDPPFAGHLELNDLETGHKVEVTLNARMLELYRKNVDGYCTMARDWCRRYGFSYSLAPSSQPLEDLLLKHLRERGMVK